MTFPIGPVILAARAWFNAHLREGVFCFVCGRHAKIRVRSISAPQVKALLAVLANHALGQRWTHTRKLNPAGLGFSCPDFTCLKHWGLIEPKPGKSDPRKKTSGYWGVTPLAIDWVHGRVTIPRHVDVRDDQVTGVSEDDRVTIQDTLGTTFNYSEFVARITPREPQLPTDETPP